MTVQKDVTKNIYVGNGSTRTFPFTFECPAEHPEYIKVYLMQDDGTALATSDYQLDMDARQITYPSSGTALPEGKKLVIMRELPLQQMMNLVNNGPYFAEDIETALDECIMALQQIAEKLNRTITMSVDIDGDAFVNEVPFEAGKSFRIADDGKSIVLTEDPARVLPLAQEAYAQTKAQAQIASASAAAAAKSEDSAFESAASAAENAELTSGYKQEALTAKADAAASATNAKASEASAKISENNAEASKEAAQSAATTASNFASDARSSANEARTYRDNAKTYMDNTALYMNNAKNYSENVNVFIPSVSTEGVLSWTNKAGLTNPKSVNIKGAKGDTGTAATITIGSVTTGEPGTNVVVSNSGTSTNAILNFTIPGGQPGADGGVEVDEVLSGTSLKPIANKAVYTALQDKANQTELNELALKSGVLTTPNSRKAFVSKIANDALAPLNNIAQLTIEQSADGETWETLFDSATTTDEKWKKAYISGLTLPSSLNITKGYMARITFATHTNTYFSSISFHMVSTNSTGSSGSNYKCYYGYNTLDTTIARASGAVQTCGSWVNTIFKSTGYNIVQYVFNEDKNENVTLSFSGALCKGTKAYRNVLNYDSDKVRTVTEYPVEAPTFIGNLTGTADKATSDGAGNVITETYAKKDTANKWNALQRFKQVLLGAERYLSTVVSDTSHTPQMSVMHYIATGTFTLNLQKIVASLEPSNSSVFTAYIESSADYPLHIENAGALKYIGSASDIAITSAGLLLNILMMKDASDNVTSIVQASKLEGAA